MNEFELNITLNTDVDNVGFLLITEVKTKNQKSYYTEQLDKKFIKKSIDDFIENNL